LHDSNENIIVDDIFLKLCWSNAKNRWNNRRK